MRKAFVLSKSAALMFFVSFSASVIAQDAVEPPKRKTIGGINSNNEPEEIIEPEKKSTPVRSAQIDTERFELGVFGGFLNAEDFSSNTSFGVSFSYHITKDIITQVNRGKSNIDKATFEESLGPFLSDTERDFSYFTILGGYRVLHGRSFIGSTKKMNSSIYLMGGFGQIEFAGNEATSFEFAASYRTVVTDWMTINLDIRNHMFDREVAGTLTDEKTTHNTELVLGVNALF